MNSLEPAASHEFGIKSKGEIKPILFTFVEAGAASGTTAVYNDVNKSNGFSSVTLDSREAGEGALFTALEGGNADGHFFVEDAFRNGAFAALVDRDKTEKFNLIKLARQFNRVLYIAAHNEVLYSLQKLAKCHLQKFPSVLRIAITGSTGKTSTKELAAAIIKKEKNVFYNKGNMNSCEGLPLSVFGVNADTEVLVCEAGMNRAGEIAEEVNVLMPHVALITNVGSAHIGIIGSRLKILDEKKQIFSMFNDTVPNALKKNVALIPEGSEYAELLSRDVEGDVINYSIESAGITNIKNEGLKGSTFLYNGEKVIFSLPGTHNIQNAAAAIAIAKVVGIKDESIVSALNQAVVYAGRGEIVERKTEAGNLSIINDSYNANPASMFAALDYCDSIDWNGRKIYVIGEMLELGEKSGDYHKDLFLRLKNSRADLSFFYRAGDDFENFKSMVTGSLQDGDLVLLKGSRSCALERIMEGL